MKSLHVIHAVFTAVLALGLVTFGLLVLTGKVEVRVPAKTSDDTRPRTETPGDGPANPAGARGRLVVVRGLKPGVVFQLFDGPNFIGRADEKPVEVDIADEEPPDRVWSSRQHAVITCEKGSLFLEDLNSANGTYVNRTRVPPGEKRELKGNDFIQIGTVQLQVRL